jgi:folate-binding protein YgfZ
MSKIDYSPMFDAVRNRAAVCRLPERGILEVTGADAASFLNNFCTNDILHLQPGQGCEAFFTTLQGKTISLAWLFRHADGVTIDCGETLAASLLGHLDRYLIMEKAKLKDRSHDLASWLVVGPEARDVLRHVFGSVPDEAAYAHAQGKLGDNSVELRDVQLAWPQGVVVVARAPFADEVDRALTSAGIERIAIEVVDALRVENRYPANGHEVTEDRLPQELLRDVTAISFKKGCYLGQETIARLDALGHVNWHLVRLSFATDASLIAGQPLDGNDGKAAGHITSFARVADGETLRALAIVRRQFAKPGEMLSAGGQAGTIA